MEEKKNGTDIDKENMAKNHFCLQVSQKVVLYNPEEQKFLLVKDVNENNFFSTHYGPWELPGGRLLAKESLEESLKRELSEELGKEVNYEIVDTFSAIGIEYQTGKAIAIGHLLFYRGGEIRLSEEHTEFRWASLREIQEGDDYKPWLKDFVEKAAKRLEERDNLNGWKRCQADFENYKKKQSETQKEMIQFSNMNLIMEIIPVIDNFHVSTDHIPAEQKEQPWVTGIMYIKKQLEDVLNINGVTEILVQEGDSFNPQIHEAIKGANCEEKSKECKNKIKKVIQRGYKMGERVIRPARVIVE